MKPKFGFANPGTKNPETKKPDEISEKKKISYKPIKCKKKMQQIKANLLDIFFPWLNLRIWGLSDGFWGTNRRMGLGAEDGGFFS